MVTIGEYTFDDKNVLYNRDGILVAVAPERGEREHDLVVGERYQALPRGVLEELAKTDRYHFEDSIDALTGGTIIYILEESDTDVSLSDLRIAFAQARVRELEVQLAEAIGMAMSPRTRR